MKCRPVYAGAVTLAFVAGCLGRVSSDGGGSASGDSSVSVPARPADPDARPKEPSNPVEREPSFQACEGVVDVVGGPVGGYAKNTYQGRAGAREIVAIGVYETRSDHGPGVHPEGVAVVKDTRKEPHVLLLSSYEPTQWTIEGGSTITEIFVVGYHAQRVIAPAGVRVVNDSASHKGALCTYKIPDDGRGCESDDLINYAVREIGSPISYFAGRYTATHFVVSDCQGTAWQPSTVDTSQDATSACRGKSYVRFNAQYTKWVNAVLCDNNRYKLYLAESKEGPFYPIADGGGHGQDHCELVNTAMRMLNPDTIDTRTCSGCDAEAHAPWSWPGAIPVYVRHDIGEPFTLASWLRWEDPDSSPISPYITASSYRCGVAIPGD